MAKIPRVKQEIFGKNAGSKQITAFGTAKTETPIYTTDIAAIQNDNYMHGWQPALLPDKAPYEEDMNALFYAVTSQLAYLYQEGIPEYDSNTTYSKNALVRGAGEAVIYYSLVNDNQGNPLTNPTYWAVFFSTDSFGDITEDLGNLKIYVDNQIAGLKGYIDTEIAKLQNRINTSLPVITNANGCSACKIGTFIIQWGQITVTRGQPVTVGFAIPFSNTTYKVVAQMMNEGIRNAYSNTQVARIGNTVSFVIAPNFVEQRDINWVAIGQ